MGVKPFQNYLDSVGYTLAKMAIPERTKVYIHYNKLTKELVRLSNRVDTNISDYKFIDIEYTNQNEYNAALAIADGLCNKAIVKWYDDLQAEYSDLTPTLFSIVYNKAYEDGHHAGYDEVANRMIDASQFAEDIIKAWKEQN